MFGRTFNTVVDGEKDDRTDGGANERSPCISSAHLRVGMSLLPLVSVIEYEKEKHCDEHGEKRAEEGVFDVTVALVASRALHRVHVAAVRGVDRKHVHGRRAVRMLNADIPAKGGGKTRLRIKAYSRALRSRCNRNAYLKGRGKQRS